MKSLIIMGLAMLQTTLCGCIHSYYDYSLQQRDRGEYPPAAENLMRGRIDVDYERFGIYPHGKGFRMDPATPLKTLLTMPIAICTELPLHWTAKKSICYKVCCQTDVSAIRPVTIKYPVRYLTRNFTVEDNFRTVEERNIAGLRWTTPHGSQVSVILIEEKGVAEEARGVRWWRYRLRILDGDKTREVKIPYFDCYTNDEPTSWKFLITYDGKHLYLFNRLGASKYFNCFWRDDGNTQDVALVQYDIDNDELKKMIWFNKGDIYVSDEIQLEKSTLKTASGWLWCELEQ